MFPSIWGWSNFVAGTFTIYLLFVCVNNVLRERVKEGGVVLVVGKGNDSGDSSEGGGGVLEVARVGGWWFADSGVVVPWLPRKKVDNG